MSLTYTKQKEGVAGDLRYWSGTITFDTSYTTNGMALSLSSFGFASTIFALDISGDDGLLFQFDRANSKIKVYFPTGGGGTSPTTVINAVLSIASGSTAVTSTSANPTPSMAPGVAVEVGSTCNLSSVIIQVFALGQ